MKGILLTHKSKVSREITQINNLLFGRVIQVKRKDKKYYYYYPGELCNTKFYKINKGCYFIITKKDIGVIGAINIINCDIDITKDKLITPSEYFRNKYNGKEVINL